MYGTLNNVQQFGDAETGFGIAVENSVLMLSGWGFWGSDLAARLTPAVLDACRKAGRTISAVIDGTRLRPQGDAGQEALQDMLGKLRQLGVTGATITVSSALTRMQLMRIVKDAGVKELVQFSSP
jgi:hypothetical protein